MYNLLVIIFQQELEYCKSVVLSVEDELGVRTVMEDLLSVITHNTEAPVCTAAVLILNTFCANTTVDVSEYLPQLFRGLIGLFARSDERLLNAAWNCLDAITKVCQCVDNNGLIKHEKLVSTEQLTCINNENKVINNEHEKLTSINNDYEKLRNNEETDRYK